MIELKDLTIQKGNTHILKKLNLKFQCGKSYALIGKSGCGKSTLLNTIAGLEKTGKQYVYFNGQLEQFKSNFYRDKLESSPDSCVKCYTMFLPFLLIK
ncbi:ATP-binding cassette domain-containing protein, partial [Staphylococcus aureus]|uniref:ATP-binding cassette domain-containing protein n=1 Tax=Staphylococcus aureus TaxID=1280 RepID=UPI004058BAE4